MSRDRFLIITTMKNEGPFILEWIAYNLAIGFDDFLVYTNDCADGTDRIILRLEELGLAHHVDNVLKEGDSPQRRALRRSRKHPAFLAADWAICADVDEFLLIHPGAGTLDDLMEAVLGAEAVSVCWRLFGNGGVEDYRDRFVTEQFTWAAPELEFPNYRARGMKTLFRRTEKFTRMGVHRPRYREDVETVNWVDGGGQPMPSEYLHQGWSAHSGFRHDLARLHHYSVRSIDSFLVKRDRGRTNHINVDQGLDYWRDMNTNMVRDESILPRLPAARDRFEALMADPELRRLHDEACAWHRAKIAELKEREGWPAFRAQIAAMNRPPEDAPPPLASEPAPEAPALLPPARRTDAEIVLHGGFHKTASSHIQSILRTNADRLARDGVRYIDHRDLRKGFTFPCQLNAYEKLNVDRRTKISDAELRSQTIEFFDKQIAGQPGRIVLSEENMAGHCGHCVQRGTLYHFRKRFLEVFAGEMPGTVREVHVAIRNYADFFAAAYVEYLRSAKSATGANYVPERQMILKVTERMPNWHDLLRAVGVAFPEARLHVWRYEDYGALSETVLANILGPGVDIGRLAPPKDRNARPSASHRAVEELLFVAETEGIDAAAARRVEIQEAWPRGAAHPGYDPWTAQERAHLTRTYDRDWDAIRRDPALTIVAP
ncbi:MAG: glycosyltransferase family 2 protein [Rubricella sp.]